MLNVCVPNIFISFPVPCAYHVPECETVIACVPVCVPFPCLTYFSVFPFPFQPLLFGPTMFLPRVDRFKCSKEG